MIDERKLEKYLTKYKKSIENKGQDYIEGVLNENFVDKAHIMFVEEVDLSDVYNQLSDLEKADLIDFWNKEKNERTNKKRGNLLC